MSAGQDTRTAQQAHVSARSNALALFSEETTRGFAIRFILLAALLLLVPWAVSLAELSGMLRFLVPLSGAVILVVAYTRWPMEALYTLAIYVAFYDSIGIHIPNIKQIDELSVALILPIALMRSWRLWRTWIWWPRDLLIAAAIGVGIVSSLVANVPTQVWLPALALAVKALIFFYVVLWSRFETWSLAAAARVTVVLGVVVVALGLVEMLFRAEFQGAFGLNEYRRFRGEVLVVKSLFAHPALFGFFSTFAAIFGFALYITTRRRIWLAAALFVSLGTFLSARRRAILALAGSLIAGLVASRRWLSGWRDGLRVWLPVAAGLLLLVAVFQSGMSESFARGWGRYIDEPILQPGEVLLPGETENTQARIALYKTSALVGRDYFPLGAGLGRYGSWLSREQYSPLYAAYGLDDIRGLSPERPAEGNRRARVAAPSATDTFWPAILGEMGVFGLIAYLGFMATLGWMLWFEVRREDGLVLRTFRLAAGMVFAQAILESAASSMFYSPPRVYLVYLVVGIVASVAWRRRASTTE